VHPMLSATIFLLISSTCPSLEVIYVIEAWLTAPSFCSRVQERRRVLLGSQNRHLIQRRFLGLFSNSLLKHPEKLVLRRLEKLVFDRHRDYGVEP
jgi:hypothetical protein